MSVVPVVHDDPEDAERRLRELRLTAEILLEAIRAGEAARQNCGSLVPRWFPGSSASANTTRSLREQLIPLRWEMNEDGGYSRTISPDRVAIVVATGNAGTGTASSPSSTKYPKGPATVEAVEANLLQLEFELGGLSQLLSQEAPAVAVDQLWILLVARVGREVRGELSRPEGFDATGRVTVWTERIILPPISLDGEGDEGRLPEPGPDFDVDVVRRVG